MEWLLSDTPGRFRGSPGMTPTFERVAIRVEGPPGEGILEQPSWEGFRGSLG